MTDSQKPSHQTTMPVGWEQRPNGDVWTNKDRPVLYRIADGWMVAGIRSAEELSAIAKLARESP